MTTRTGEPEFQIGEVADRTGVTQRTLRFYEEKGLLNMPLRMDGGFRLYTEADIKRVEQIKQLQNLLGLSLAEIKEMVESQEALSQLRAEYRKDADVEQKLAQIHRAMAITTHQQEIVQQKLAQLQTMSQQFEQRLQTYNTWIASLTSAREPEPVAGR